MFHSEVCLIEMG